MRHTLVFLFVLGVFLVPMAGLEAGDANDVRAILKKILAAAADEDPGALEAAVGEAVLHGVPADRKAVQLSELRAALTGASVGTVELNRDKAVAELKRTGRIKDRSQVRLIKDGGTWRLAAPYVHQIDSPDLDARRGKKPVQVSLGLRTKGGAYGDTAYSFRYATGDALACKNRVDIWVCHNDDIHVRGDNRIVDLGRKKLAKVKGIPAEGSWDRKAPIVAGHTYVVHCRDKRDADFFVKLRVKSFKRNVVEMEWTLLTTGFGAPASIHMPGSVPGNAGADGSDGLCGKSR